MMFAWHIDSSEIVAFILRVRSRSLLWNSFIFSDTCKVDCLPFIASFFRFQDKLVTQSRINSFSSSCSFLLLSLYSRILILASSASSSGSSPSNSLHLFLFSGSSSSLDSSFSLFLVSWIFCCSSMTSLANFGTWYKVSCETLIFLSISAMWMRIILISSSSPFTATSDFLRIFSWTFDFSQRIQSSSFRSISCIPVQFLFSQASQYCTLRLCISFCKESIIIFNFQIQLIFWSTSSFFCFLTRSYWFSFALVWSRVWIYSWSIWSEYWIVLFFYIDSFFRIQSQFCITFMRYFSQARSWEEFWIRFTYLFLADFTYSYKALKCYSLFSVSWYFLVRSRISNSFTLSSSRVSLTSFVATEALRAIDSLTAVETLISFKVLLTKAFLAASSYSLSLICFSMLFLEASPFFPFSSQIPILFLIKRVSSLISQLNVAWLRDSAIKASVSFFSFSVIILVSKITSSFCCLMVYSFLMFFFILSIYLRCLLRDSLMLLISFVQPWINSYSQMMLRWRSFLLFSMLMISSFLRSLQVSISSTSKKSASFSLISLCTSSSCSFFFCLKVSTIFFFLQISSRKSLISLSIPTISMCKFSALLAQWSGESLIFNSIYFSFSSSSWSSLFSLFRAVIKSMLLLRFFWRDSMFAVVFQLKCLVSWMSASYFYFRGFIFYSAILKSSYILSFLLETSFYSSSDSKNKFSYEAL